MSSFSRLSSVEAEIQSETKGTQKSRSLEQDLLEVSPFNRIRQTLKKFKQYGLEDGKLEVSYRTSTTDSSSSLSGGTFDQDLDLMLRMLSDDDEEYQKLKARFNDLFKLARGEFSQSNQSAEVQTDSTPAQMADSAVGSDESSAANSSQENSSSASVTTFTVQNVEIKIEIRKVETSFKIDDVKMKKADPLVLDLNGDGLDLTAAGEGAEFDIDGDGQSDTTGWVKGDDALLVYDKNGNGKIDDGKELFGDQNGASDGFAELAKYDQNGDKSINQKDSIYKALKLYRDLNGNGKIETGEVSNLASAGISAINLQFSRDSKLMNGNSLLLQGSFTKTDGSQGVMNDVLFGYKTRSR